MTEANKQSEAPASAEAPAEAPTVTVNDLVNIYNIMQALVLNFQKSSHQQAIEFNGACFLLSVLCTNDLYMG